MAFVTTPGIARRDVRGVVRAERGADRDDVAAGPRRDVREHLVAQVTVVLVVPAGAVRGWIFLLYQLSVVDRVDADQLEVAGVDLVGERAREAEVLVLVEAPHRRREDEDRAARGPRTRGTPSGARARRSPGAVFAFHGRGV